MSVNNYINTIKAVFKTTFLSSTYHILLTAIVIGVLGISTANAQQAEHVVLISIDGSRPEFYVDSTWHAPHLQALKEEGVYAAKSAQSVFPSVTYPSHTTIVTGAYPATHGIYYNAPFEGKPGHWNWNESEIQTKTLWDAVKEAGMRSVSVFWPVSVDGPIDYNLPVRRPERDEKEQGENKLTITKPYITPKHLLADIEEKTGYEFTPHSFGH